MKKMVDWKCFSRIVVATLLLTLIVVPVLAHTVASSPGKRTIYMIAFEPKGSTTVEKEPFPTDVLPDGGGYKLIPPDENGKWTIETYRWMPSQIVVYEGEEITLEILGVNGKLHKGSIEDYVEEFVVERGKITTLTFLADKAGIFQIRCTNHQPAMEGQLVVLSSPE